MLCNCRLLNLKAAWLTFLRRGGYTRDIMTQEVQLFMALSETIYRLRTEHGLSQGDLAAELDVSRQSISKWETGSSVPELDKLVAMSRLFGVTLDELVLGVAQSDGAEGVEAPEPEAKPVERGRSITQTIVGAVLLAVGALAFFLVTLLGGVLTGLVLALPFLLCGVICLAVRRGAGLWCAWLLFVGFESYICYATGYSSPFAVLRVILLVPVASSHYMLLAIWAVIYAGLLAGTALYFAGRPVLLPKREARLALAAALVFAATFLLGLLGGLPRFVLLVFPFVRYVMFTVLVTVGLRYLRARKRK